MQLLVWGETPLAAYLVASLESLHTVTWLVSEGTAQAVEETGGVRLDGQVHAVNVVTDYADAPTPDWLWLATPNWATADAMMTLRMAVPFGDAPPLIISMQNGKGSLERIESTFGDVGVPYSVAVAVTRPVWFPTFKDGDPIRSEVKSRAIGGAAVQGDHSQSEAIIQLLNRIGMATVAGWREDITWSSVFWGIQANAISAIVDIAAQDVYRDPVWQTYEMVQLQEALRVIGKLDARLMRLPGVNVPLIARQVRHLPRPVLPPALSTHPRPPTLKHDLRFEHGRSDAAYFNGAVAVAAKDLKLRTPINHGLALTLTDIAEGKLQWKAFIKKPSLLQSSLRLAQG